MAKTLRMETTRQLELFLQSEQNVLTQWLEVVQLVRAQLLRGDFTGGIDQLQNQSSVLIQHNVRRMDLLAAVAAELDLPADAVTLTTVLNYLDEETRLRLRGRSRQLQALFRQIRLVSNANTALLLQTASVFHRAVNTVTRGRSPVVTYGAAGQLQTVDMPGELRREC